MFGSLTDRVAQLTLVALTFASANLTMAATANLDDLILGSTLNLGSVSISNFTETNASTSGVASQVNTSQVVVTANLIGNELSLDFVPFVASANNGGSVDYDFTFTVTSNAGISSAKLTQIGGGPDATSFVQIDESITYAGGSMSLMTNDASIIAMTALPNPKNITVEKKINVRSGAASSQVSGLRQTYVLIPEMNAWGLAMLAMIGGVGITRKARRNQQ